MQIYKQYVSDKKISNINDHHPDINELCRSEEELYIIRKIEDFE